MDAALVGDCESHPLGWRWLLVFLVLIPFVFHGCHFGGHDDDLLKVCPPAFHF